MTVNDTQVPDHIRRYLLTGGLITLLLVGGIGGWAALTNLAGAVVAPGTVVVATNVKKVQHLAGGVVREIRVREGDLVNEGELLIRLDDTVTRANLGVIVSQINELLVREARLSAERDGAASMEMPRSLMARAADPEIAEIFTGERTLFESRRAARLGQQSQLKERIVQLREEISGLDAQRAAKSGERELMAQELAANEKLWAANHVPLSKIMALRRDATRIDGERAQLISAIAQAKGKIAEIELQIIQIDQDMRADVMKSLRDVQGKLAELSERRVAAGDILKHIDIASPQTGFVNDLSVHTVGGVVNAGQIIMSIVPKGDTLVIDVKIPPADIDQVQAGQETFVRFPAFNQRRTPEVKGEVQRVSADLIKDAQTGQVYYIARIMLPREEIERLGQLKLMPGMPAEVYLLTGERTAISYFVKPLSDQVARAFIER